MTFTKTPIYGAVTVTAKSIFLVHETLGLIQVPFVEMTSDISDLNRKKSTASRSVSFDLDYIFESTVSIPHLRIRKENRFNSFFSKKARNTRQDNIDDRDRRNIREAHHRSKERDLERCRQQKSRKAS